MSKEHLRACANSDGTVEYVPIDSDDLDALRAENGRLLKAVQIRDKQVTDAVLEIREIRAKGGRLENERDIAWSEVARIRHILRAIVPEAKCDGVDLPSVIGAEVERLRQEYADLKECHDEHYRDFLQACKENAKLRNLLAVLPEFDWDTHIGEAGGNPWNPHVDWDDYMAEVRAALEADKCSD